MGMFKITHTIRTHSYFRGEADYDEMFQGNTYDEAMDAMVKWRIAECKLNANPTFALRNVTYTRTYERQKHIDGNLINFLGTSDPLQHKYQGKALATHPLWVSYLEKRQADRNEALAKSDAAAKQREYEIYLKVKERLDNGAVG